MTTSLRASERPAAGARSAAASDARRDPWAWVFAIGALGNLANGAWMLADPAGWYAKLPAAVPDFGPLNEHFVRDIGSRVHHAGGRARVGARSCRALRVAMLGIVTTFYVLHALVHVYDTLRGLVGGGHWAIDFPGVYFPAIVLVALLVVLARAERRQGRDA